MAKRIRTIGVLTSGGDAPGMNAAIRSVVRTALGKGLRVRGIRRGYQGLMEEEIIDLQQETYLIQFSAEVRFSRLPDVRKCVQKKDSRRLLQSVRNTELKGLLSLVETVLFAGAQKLAKLGINTIGIPGTIDLDIDCTEYTIGFDTAVNTAMEAIDKVRDTSTSHQRCSIVEVMGRDAGYLALWCGIANGAEEILLPEEHNYDESEIIKRI